MAAEHNELVAEMNSLERLSTQERLKLARKRRLAQLKKYQQREKEFASGKRKSSETANSRTGKGKGYKVHFVPSVMLLEAAARNDIEEVRRLLMLGVSPDSTNEDGLTALHQCCIDDSEPMMKLLIEFGANVNAKDSEAWTPLHAASTCGHLHLVKYLILKGADLLAVNADGNMPYDICEDEVTLDFIESEMAKKGITQEMIDETRAVPEKKLLADLMYLVEAGEDIEFRDQSGATPLHIAAANGYLSVVEYLLDHHASTDVVDNDNWQPIHASACWGHPDVLEALVQAGCDLNAKTKNGETVLDICEDLELKERIIQLKSEMETKRQNSHTNKLKRSHSSNTRTHSVRRTSIREKTQISRREAREEARLRESAAAGQANGADDEDDQSKSAQGDIQELDSGGKKLTSAGLNTLAPPVELESVELLLEGSNGSKAPTASSSNGHHSLDNSTLAGNNGNGSQSVAQPTASLPTSLVGRPALPPPSDPKKEAVVIRNSGFSERDSFTSNGQQQAVVDGSGKAHGSPGQDSNNSPTGGSLPRGSSGESVKVEIHVTVNTTPTYGSGTLADLKKQRSDMRLSRSTGSSDGRGSPSDSPPNSGGGGGNGSGPDGKGHNNSHLIRATYMLDGANPPSPSSTLKKFRGDPSEVVGSEQTKGCCVIC